MKSVLFRPLSVLSAVLFSASFAQAGIITQWGWNLNAAGTVVVPLAIGTGTYNNANVSGVGSTITVGTGFVALASGNFPAASVGSSNDTAAGVGKNGYAQQNSANISDASGQGVQFKVSTVGQNKIAFQLDFKPGSRASKYWQVVYTSNGTTWQNAPSNGIGSISSLGVYTGTTITNSGLVTIAAPAGLNTTTGNSYLSQSGWIQGLSYEFPTGGAWENNANFGVALYQIYNPNPTGATDTGFVSAVTGLNSTDSTSGYIRSSGLGGTQRFDLVTVASVPEPTGLLAVGAASLVTLARRRKTAK